jgi:hypothetical protein
LQTSKNIRRARLGAHLTLPDAWQKLAHIELTSEICPVGNPMPSTRSEKRFKRHRQAIERVANDKYDAGMIEDHADAAVVVTEADMASSLSRKM